jgi:hypothetical protein
MQVLTHTIRADGQLISKWFSIECRACGWSAAMLAITWERVLVLPVLQFILEPDYLSDRSIPPAQITVESNF